MMRNQIEFTQEGNGVDSSNAGGILMKFEFKGQEYAFASPINEAFARVFAEFMDAVKKHEEFPDDIIHMTAIMMEEAGEAMQAANDVVHADASLEPLRTELAQTAAMCIRCLVNLEDRA